MFRVDDNFALSIVKVPPPDPASGFIRACIDLIEPTKEIDGELVEVSFYMESGETRVLDFTYNVGYPAAHAIGALFFSTPADATDLRNPVVADQPAVILNPQVPQEDVTGVLEQRGTLTVTAPQLPADTEFVHYFGALVIYQNELEE